MSGSAFPELQRDLSFHPVMNPTPRVLTAAQIEQYNTWGYIVPLDVLTPAEVAEHRAYFEQLLANTLAHGWNHYAINGWQARCPGIYDLVTHPRVLDYVQDLLGDPLLCQIAGRRQTGQLASGCLVLAADAQQDRDGLVGDRRCGSG